ncbi:SurA N-terminal domain-containing protein [Dasania sp. GY-MA-18]|uniref:Periplasmic chaperone PpiD n=1 Tax=Dasania phycosphaerae TaxID=2950436 RepID=A0A9J6RIV1_9GAMM|nr:MULTISPECIES: SurA N-terminal domain-containing protein [Dasania]MCR8921928.1 SurA N-terminal domain-containing protein [Dasania sp. GY-MA-18]MCZ0864356.1 SurA N-terminal domain-containing protein [Dasania phycosphaerae]MCZ0868084.1 SurA N-terminal domain-containing protein [Dasania phycosphaerae]
MLQNIRDNSQGIIAKIIVSLIVVIFAAAGVESLLGNSGSNAAAEINGEELSVIELEQAIRVQQRRLLESMGENADPSLLNDELIKQSALEQLIQQKLLLQAALDQGISASPATIDQLILNMPQFQQDGKFSPQLYENVLRSNGYSMGYFKELLRNDVIIRQLSSGIAGSDFVTQQELAYAASIVGQKRSFDYLTLSIAEKLAAVSVSDEELNAYYQDNIERFQREPKLKLAYIELKQSDFAQPVDEEAIKAAYELEMADFSGSEERKASHILLEITDQRNEAETKALALELKAKIDAGEDFASLAEQHSEDTGSAFVGGDLGYSSGDAFPEAFDEVLFAAEQGVVSEPVVTEAGVHLILVTDIKTVEQPSYEDRRLAIKQRLELEQAEATFVSRVENLRDLVFNSADLKGPAKELDLTVQQSDWLGRSDSAGVLSQAKVMKAAFSDEVLKDGNNSAVLELAADHYIVVRVLEHKPAEPKPFAEVSEQISQNLKKTKAAELLKGEAEQLLAKLNSGESSFASLQDNERYSVKSEQEVSRVTAKAPRELSAAIFAMAKPKSGDAATYASHSLRNGDVAIAGLSQVVEGKLSDLSEGEQQAIEAQLYRANSTQSLEAYQQSIRDSADITMK